MQPDEFKVITRSPVHPDIAIETDLKTGDQEQIEMPDELRDDSEEPETQN